MRVPLESALVAKKTSVRSAWRQSPGRHPASLARKLPIANRIHPGTRAKTRWMWRPKQETPQEKTYALDNCCYLFGSMAFGFQPSRRRELDPPSVGGGFSGF